MRILYCKTHFGHVCYEQGFILHDTTNFKVQYLNIERRLGLCLVNAFFKGSKKKLILFA